METRSGALIDRMTRSMDLLWDGWMATVGMVNWTADRTDTMVRSWMDQGKVGREDGTRLLEEFHTQTAGLQKRVTELFEETLGDLYVPFVTERAQLEELHRKIDEILSRLNGTGTSKSA